MKFINKLIWIILIVFPVFAAGQSCLSLDTLEWILGEWHQDGTKSITVERWTKVSSQTYDGVGQTRSKEDDKITFLESLRLVEMAGEVFYLAKVSHNEFPVPFKLTGCSESTAVFENITHDFPQKIEYKLLDEGQNLYVTVSNNERQFMVEYKKFEEE